MSAALDAVWGRAKRPIAVFASLCSLSVIALVGRALTLPLPAELAGRAGMSESIRFDDRDSRTLRELRADDSARARWVPLEEMGDDVVNAILAAEDRRFFSHPGVDPGAVVRAVLSDLTHARVVSGASTLTMQLARLVRPHRRNLVGKFEEAALALRIEASLGKREILEQYLNRAPFGAGVRGIDAASRFWFDKAPRDLSLAEAAALAAVPRGPALYALDKHADRVLRRRDRILRLMVSGGAVSADRAERATREPLVVRKGGTGFGAPHLMQALAEGVPGLWPVEAAPSPRAAEAERVETTIDRDLQREVEVAAREELRAISDRRVTSASIVVLENATGDILAYVGSPDFGDDLHGGQNDGVRARRQPGSTLKPFIYGLTMERLGWTAATVLPDVELHLEFEDGPYSPKNYDGRFHGPIRMREALGSSLNVPAVWATDRSGVAAVLDRLRGLGFASLHEDERWYGPGIALGDGEVTLLELANAYATIARGGVAVSPRAVRRVVQQDGALDVPAGEATQVMPREVADVLADVLADPRARVAAFGEQSALDLPFEVAAKTGTSKGSRDNWTVGFTRDVTVAVWVGNFDGSAMQGTSGITGAAPLFHRTMEAAMRGREARPLRLSSRSDRDPDLVEVEVCPLSGRRPTASCPHAVHEWMPRASRDDLGSCTMHELVRVDRRDGRRAGAGCPPEFVEDRVFERYDGAMRAWASAVGRPLAPEAFSLECPDRNGRASSGTLRIGWPNPGSRFVVDPDRPLAEQRLFVRLDVPDRMDHVELLVDGHAVARVGSPFVAGWRLSPGEHVLVSRAQGGGESPAVTITVQ